MALPKPSPTHFGRYEVEAEIGAGSMGVVYRCRDPRLNRTVAVKVLRESQFLTPVEKAQYEARFRHEGEAAGRLSHPQIVQIYDVGPAYIVMEHLEGRNLAALLLHGPRLSVGRACEIVGHVAEAVDYAHRHGIVHRDIMPANVMLLGDGGIKVMDFGVARLDSSTLTVLGTVVGSVRYMSPEQMMGDRVDGRADVFSLAAVAYEMLCRQAPFPGKTVTEVVSRVVRGAHIPLRDADARMPEGLNAVFARAFAPKPEDRPARATEFARDLRAAAGSVLDLEVGGELAAARRPPEEAAPQEATVFMSSVAPVARQAVLLLESDPPAEVEVDGRKVGRTPLALELPFGPHELRLSAVGRDPITHAVDLSAERPFQALGVTLPTSGGESRVGELVAFGPGVVPPRRIAGALPRYPEAARQLGLEGVVEVELTIDVRGSSQGVSLKRSAGAVLDEAMLRAVAGWRFAPASARGTPVQVRLLVRHLFRR
jgi:serine/threonine-protein kinase